MGRYREGTWRQQGTSSTTRRRALAEYGWPRPPEIGPPVMRVNLPTMVGGNEDHHDAGTRDTADQVVHKLQEVDRLLAEARSCPKLPGDL